MASASEQRDIFPRTRKIRSPYTLAQIRQGGIFACCMGSTGTRNPVPATGPAKRVKRSEIVHSTRKYITQKMPSPNNRSRKSLWHQNHPEIDASLIHLVHRGASKACNKLQCVIYSLQVTRDLLTGALTYYRVECTC